MALFLSMLALGLISSLHCVGMCGPLVMTYAVRDEGAPLGERVLAHGSYQSARIVSYMLVGAVMGAIGSVLDLGGVRGWAMLVAGALMILIGVSATGLVPSLRRIRVPLPHFLTRWVGGVERRVEESASRGGAARVGVPIALGLLTGLMPCAALQVAELAAATSGAPSAGALAMLGFGLGTMPVMLGVGVASGYVSARLKKRMLVVAALAIVVLGAVTLDRGATLVGSPITARTVVAALRGDGSGSNLHVGADGVPEARLAIVNTTYVPSTIDIPSGRPVRLIVDRKENVSCSDELVIPRLGVRANLKPNGLTVIDLPSTTKGVYAMTCGMGMMSGQVRSGPATGGPNWELVAMLALSLGCVGLVLVVRQRLVLRR
ncbi:MAG: sulfite exporter TauE/SafE family protein [Coriobacteriia bacterium]|nr:sulfite exporter TauE/SafE family protein [Coriobacteriia bacterium]